MTNAPRLIRIQRFDSISLDSTYFTSEGFLIDEPIVTTVGIFEYTNPDGSTRKELRLPEHVFEKDSLDSYEGKPVIITHDAGKVDKENVGDVIVGTILTKGYKDGEDVRAKIVVHDIDEVKESGLRELSLGYDLVLDETPGVWKGQKYDAIQTAIRINHLALVGDARAGSSARLNIDGKNKNVNDKGGKAMSKTKNAAMGSNELKKSISDYELRRKRRLDEKKDEEKPKTDAEYGEEKNKDEESYEKNKDYSYYKEKEPSGEKQADSDSYYEKIPEKYKEKLAYVKDRRDRRDEYGEPDSLETAYGIIAQQDEEIDVLLDIIEEMQAKQDYDSSCVKKDEDYEGEDYKAKGDYKEVHIHLDSKVGTSIREHIMLGKTGDMLGLPGLEMKTPIEAKKAIIKKMNPAMNFDGRGTAYINAAFDVAMSQIETNPPKGIEYQRSQMSGRFDANDDKPTGAMASRQAMIKRMKTGGEE